MGPTKEIKYPLPILLTGVTLLAVLLGFNMTPGTISPYGQEGPYPLLNGLSKLPGSYTTLVVFSATFALALFLIERAGSWLLGKPISFFAGLILLCQPGVIQFLRSPLSIELFLLTLWGGAWIALLFQHKPTAARVVIILGILTEILGFGLWKGFVPLMVMLILRVFHKNGKEISARFILVILLTWLGGALVLYRYSGLDFSAFMGEYLLSPTVLYAPSSIIRQTIWVYPLLFFAYYISGLKDILGTARKRQGSRVFSIVLTFLVLLAAAIWVGSGLLVLPIALLLAMAVYRDIRTEVRKERMRPRALLHLFGIIVYVMYLYLLLKPQGSLYDILPGIITGIVLLSGVILFLLWYEMAKYRVAYYILAAFNYFFVLGYIWFFLKA